MAKKTKKATEGGHQADKDIKTEPPKGTGLSLKQEKTVTITLDPESAIKWEQIKSDMKEALIEGIADSGPLPITVIKELITPEISDAAILAYFFSLHDKARYNKLNSGETKQLTQFKEPKGEAAVVEFGEGGSVTIDGKKMSQAQYMQFIKKDKSEL